MTDPERLATAVDTICDNYLIEVDTGGTLRIDSRLSRLVDFDALGLTEEQFLTRVEDYTLEERDADGTAFHIDWHALKQEWET